MNDGEIGRLLGSLLGGLCQISPPDQVRRVLTRIANDDDFWSILEHQLLPMTPVMVTAALVGTKIEQDQ
jgi:hypothetical protein